MRKVAPFVLSAALATGCGGDGGTEPEFPQPGDAAPGFRLPSADGNIVSLSDFAGRKVLLYFSMGPG